LEFWLPFTPSIGRQQLYSSEKPQLMLWLFYF